MNIYTWLIKNDFPKGFRILCYNCNLSLGHMGYCPHQSSDPQMIINPVEKYIDTTLCRYCSILLTDDNIHPSYKRNNRHICKNCLRNVSHQRTKALKEEIMYNYGNACIICKENKIEFLSIDHINNNGHEERKLIGESSKFYRWLKANNYPEDNYQILCYNCNMHKEHQRRANKG